MKILFLDIDGVLNSRRSAVAMNGYPHPNTNDHKFDFIAVKLIRRVCRNDVKIVLSSSWRFDKNYMNILNLPIIDRTPELIDKIRGLEIDAWLKQTHRQITKWAIVDDDDDMLPNQQHNFVHVDGKNGLLWDDYAKLCNILSIKE